MEHVLPSIFKLNDDMRYTISKWLITLATIYCLIQTHWDLKVIGLGGHFLNNGSFQCALLFIVIGYLNSIRHKIKAPS